MAKKHLSRLNPTTFSDSIVVVKGDGYINEHEAACLWNNLGFPVYVYDKWPTEKIQRCFWASGPKGRQRGCNIEIWWLVSWIWMAVPLLLTNTILILTERWARGQLSECEYIISLSLPGQVNYPWTKKICDPSRNPQNRGNQNLPWDFVLETDHEALTK